MRLDFEHPAEDELERYLLGNLAGSEVETLEEHLLLCGSCQAALEEEEVVVLAMRGACRQRMQEHAIESRRWWQIRFPIPAYAVALTALLAMLPLGYVYRGAAIVPESELALTATRSASVFPSRFAAANSTVLLHLDATSLPSRGQYLVEVVDLEGDRIWSGSARSVGNEVTVRVGERLQAGRYWVRLDDAGGQELREFDLQVR